MKGLLLLLLLLLVLAVAVALYSPSVFAELAVIAGDVVSWVLVKVKYLDANGWMAIFTLGLVVLTWRQWVHFRRTERAYVTISHYSDRAPALQLDLGGRGRGIATVKIKNYGNTPATITRIVLTLWIGDRLPRKPRYGKPTERMGFFLVKGDKADVTPPLPISDEDVARIIDGASVWLLGYADYRDAFGRSYRSGYARKFDDRDDAELENDPNNLMYEVQPGYNYDRRRWW